MTDCKRCGIIILFENGLCFSQNGVPHDIRRCKTIPGYVWCPIHRAKFSKRHSCEHYVQYGYEYDSNEEFFIKLINENYQKGDWFTRRNRTKKSGDKMKKSTCNKCNTPIHNLSESQQRLHEKRHLDQENNQNVLSEFF